MKARAENNAPPDRRALKEAKRFLKETKRLLGKNGKKISAANRERVELAMREVDDALTGSGSKRLSTVIKNLDTTVNEVLGFAKKSSMREFFDSIFVAILIAGFLRAFVVEAFKIPSGSMIPTLEVGDHIFVNKFIYGLRVPFTNAWFVEWGIPDRGEVIVFRYPVDMSKDFIKRVVAVEGDRIRVAGLDVYINDKKLERQAPAAIEYYEDAEPGAAMPFPILKRAQAFPERSQGDDPTDYTVLYELPDRSQPQFPSGAQAPGLTCVYDQPGRKSECKVDAGHVFVMGDNRDNSSDSRVWGGVPKENVKGKAMFIWWSRAQKSGIRWGRFFQGVH